MRNES